MWRGPLFTMNAEEVKVGCFQMVLVLLLGINYVIVAMSHALPIFHNYTPKFYCQTKDSTGKNYGCQGAANLSIANSTSATPEVSIFASCSGEYRFVTEFAENSVVTEWSLVCERRYLSFLGPAIYYVGVILGAWITGFLTDRIGRLPVQAICLYTQGTLAVALYVVQSYPTFLALRGLQGVFVQGLQNSTYILCLELIPTRFRTLVALIMQIFWSVGLVLLAVLSYVIPDWRILQLAVSVPTAITVLYIWIIPESPRWLLARGKSTEADMALERIAKYNSCCVRSQKESTSMQEAYAKNNTTPIKPQRKSRVNSIELKKAKDEENQREETTNLLNGSETMEQKIIAPEINSVNLENISPNVELHREMSNTAGDFDKRDLPSSSKCDRKSKTISQCDQKISPKNAEEEVVLRRIKIEKTNENEGKEGSNINKPATNKNTLESTLRKYYIIMIFQWCLSAMVCRMLNDMTPDLPMDSSINRHITFALDGALEIPACTFVYFMLCRYGRRLPMCIYQLFNGAVCILIGTLFIVRTTPWIVLAQTIILLFGKATVTSTIFIAYLYTVETFPTVIRGRCLGLCVVFAKIGSLSIGILHQLLERCIHLPTQFGIGTGCLLYGVFALALPETLNRILPDQTADITTIGDNSHKSDDVNIENSMKEEDILERQILRVKLFSEDWVDAGNGILVNFTENKNTE